MPWSKGLSDLLPSVLSRSRSFIFEDRSKMPCLGERAQDYQCKILLLDDTEFLVDTQTTCKGQVVLDKVFEHLNLIEKDYFGLRFLDDSNQTYWLDASKHVGTQLKNCSSHTLYFGVKFYAADPCKLHEEVTRYQFFLQVKRDMLQGRLPVNFDTSSELCALAVQSELGDYDPKRHSWGYVSEFRFVPNQTEELENRIMQLHRQLHGQVPAVAEYRFLDKVKWLEMYGVDLHPVQGEGNVEYFVGLTPTGVVVYRNKSKVGNYFWPRITKVTFKGKQFMVRVKDKNNDENTYAFDCTTKAACKHLWKCCIEHHAFFRLSQATDSINNMGRVFTMGSKYRYSGRTERQAVTDLHNRPPPQVVRMPSRRHQRRTSVEAKPIDFKEVQLPSNMTAPIPGLPISEPKRVQSASNVQKSYSNTADSPRSTRSAPWESGHHRKGGLYTSGRESPLSVRSEKMMFPSSHRRGTHSGSESEGGGHKRRSYHHRESDTESEISSRRHRRRRTRGADSGSESEASYRHKTRHSRKSNENLPHSDQQWREVQRRVREGYKGRHDSFGKELRPNGSLNSMPGSEASHQSANRRRRRRSRSPGHKPPQELAQHFKYIEPEPGMTEEQMRDIPFTNVETKVPAPRIKHSPHARHRQRSPRRRSYGENNENREVHRLPHDEPPPPYSAPPGQNNMNQQNSYSQPSLNHNYRNSHEVDSALKSPVYAYKNEAHVAPVVKTKPMPTYPTAQQNMYIAGSMDRVTEHTHTNQMNQSQGSSHARDDSGLGIDPHDPPRMYYAGHGCYVPDPMLPSYYSSTLTHRGYTYMDPGSVPTALPVTNAYYNASYLAPIQHTQYFYSLDPRSNRMVLPPGTGSPRGGNLQEATTLHQQQHLYKPTPKHAYIEQVSSDQPSNKISYSPGLPSDSGGYHKVNTPTSNIGNVNMAKQNGDIIHSPGKQRDMMTEL